MREHCHLSNAEFFFFFNFVNTFRRIETGFVERVDISSWSIMVEFLWGDWLDEEEGVGLLMFGNEKELLISLLNPWLKLFLVGDRTLNDPVDGRWLSLTIRNASCFSSSIKSVLLIVEVLGRLSVILDRFASNFLNRWRFSSPKEVESRWIP